MNPSTRRVPPFQHPFPKPRLRRALYPPRMSVPLSTISALLLLALAASARAAPKAQGPVAAAPDPVEKLIGEQKYQAALELLDKRIAVLRAEARAGRRGPKAARNAGDERAWTDALIRDVELRLAQNGAESAVRFLRDQPWPKGVLSRAALELYYAHTLVTYAHMYSWEIGQREQTEAPSAGALDLTAWTRGQIYAEAAKAYQGVWELREPLGAEPLGALGKLLTPNDYPAGVRDTLRDATAYFAVELFADTAGWSPEEQNETYQLDLKSLIDGNPKAAARVELDDARVHPLIKIGAILDDLEAWHARRGSGEGALEARLARLRVLRNSFPKEGELEALIQNLRLRLAWDRPGPWWAVGQAELADLLEGTDAPDNLVQARAAAEAGAQAYPDSLGGKRCRAQVEALDAPQVAIEAMQSDAAGKRSLQVTHKNLAALWFRAYPADLFQPPARGENGYYYDNPGAWLLDPASVKARLAGAPPAAAWRVDLPATPDLKTHRTFVTPPLQKAAAYVIVASAAEAFSTQTEGETNTLVASLFLLSDLVLATRRDPEDGSLSVTPLSATDGRGSAPTKVTLYRYGWRQPPAPVESHWTGLTGRVRFSAAGKTNARGSYYLIGKHGADLALATDGIDWGQPVKAQGDEGALVFTDRSIYRPLQKILWKVVGYSGNADRTKFQVLPSTPMTVRLHDGNRQLVESEGRRHRWLRLRGGRIHHPRGAAARALGD